MHNPTRNQDHAEPNLLEMQVGENSNFQDAGREAPVADAGFDWKEFNQKKKTESLDWVQSNPLLRLACIREVATILLGLMYAFLHLSSKEFEQKQKLLTASGNPRSYPVLEALRGKDVDLAMRRLYALLWTKPRICLSSLDIQPRLRVLRFRIISCAMSSMHILIELRRKGCPYKLFRILDGEHQEVLQTPPCLRDPLTEAILLAYAFCLY